MIQPEARAENNYRLYSDETLNRLKRINQLKQEKYTLEEIKLMLAEWNQISDEEQVAEKLTSLEIHMKQLERKVKELEPIISQMKPGQAKQAFSHLMPQSMACIEALRLLLVHGPFS